MGRTRQCLRSAAFLVAITLPNSSFGSSNALVKRGEDSDMGYNPVLESDELENILGLPVMTMRTVSARCGSESFAS